MPADILIVYHRTEKAQLLKGMLHTADYNVQSAGSGRSALDICREHPPALVLMSSETRDLDGLDVCRTLHQNETTESIPVIFYTNRRDAESKMHAFAAGAADYISEPFEATEVLARVQAHLMRTQYVAAANEHLKVLEETNKTKDRLLKMYSRVNHLLGDVLSEAGHRGMMQAAMRGAAELTGSQCAAIGIYEAHREQMRYEYFHGFQQAPKPFLLQRDKAAANAIFDRRAPIVVNDYHARGSISVFRDLGVRCFIGAPLGVDGEMVGVLSLFRMKDEPYGEEEEDHIWALAPVLSATATKAGYEEKLARMAMRDHLTDLWNRQYGIKILRQEIQRCGKTGHLLCAILIDMDDIRRVNESGGFPAGDAVIKQVGKLIAAGLQPHHHAARTGEEFLLILPGINLSDARHIAEGLEKRIRGLRLRYGEKQLTCTASMGLAEYRRGEKIEAFYARFDAALHRAKREGGNRVVAD